MKKPIEWFEDKQVLIERLFDKHHTSLHPSEQYGRIYLLNQDGEIVLSLLKAVEAYDSLKTENENLRKALEYYAHPEHYEPRLTMTGERPAGVLSDSGDIARAALKEEPR